MVPAPRHRNPLPAPEEQGWRWPGFSKDKRFAGRFPAIPIASLLVLSTAFVASASTPRLPSEVIPPGETLVYEIRWDPPAWMFFLPTISAGELTVQFHHDAQVDGKAVHRIAARAVSSGFFPKLTGVTVDDSFESLVATDTFCSERMTKKLREGKRHRDIYLTFDRSSGTGRYLAYDVAKTPPATLKDQEVKNIPSCVQDIVSGIYVTRLQPLTSGGKFPLIVSDDGTVKQVEVRVKQKETIEAAAGRFSAWKLETISVFGSLFRGGGSFLVWFSERSNRSKDQPVSHKLEEFLEHPGSGFRLLPPGTALNQRAVRIGRYWNQFDALAAQRPPQGESCSPKMHGVADHHQRSNLPLL
jgi:hypothetical protein